MTAKLNKELSDAVNGHPQINAVDPATGQTYVIVESSFFNKAYRQSVEAAIQRGLGSMEVGGGVPLEEARAQDRQKLIDRFQK